MRRLALNIGSTQLSVCLFLLVAGDREVEAHTLAVRTRSGKT